MELAKLILQDTLNQQEEQLKSALARNIDPNKPGTELRNKAIENLNSFIGDIKKAIRVLEQYEEKTEIVPIDIIKTAFFGGCRSRNEEYQVETYSNSWNKYAREHGLQ